MSLADEAKALTQPPGPRCRACLFVMALTEAEAAEVAEALADSTVTDTALCAALEARGHTEVPRAQSWSRHRKGLCRRGSI